MTTDRTTARLYSFAVTALVFCLMWVVIVTHPFPSAGAKTAGAQLSSQAAQIQEQQQSLAVRGQQVNAILKKRWAVYRVARRARLRQINRINATYRRQLIASKSAASAAAAAQASYNSAPSRSYAPSYSAPAPMIRVVSSAPVSHTRSS